MCGFVYAQIVSMLTISLIIINLSLVHTQTHTHKHTHNHNRTNNNKPEPEIPSSSYARLETNSCINSHQFGSLNISAWDQECCASCPIRIQSQAVICLVGHTHTHTQTKTDKLDRILNYSPKQTNKQTINSRSSNHKQANIVAHNGTWSSEIFVIIEGCWSEGERFKLAHEIQLDTECQRV